MKIQTFAPLIFASVILSSLAGCKPPDLSMPDLSLKRDTPAPVVQAPLRQPIQPIPATGRVTVQQGDTIYSIAARYQITPNSIIRDNEIGPPYVITAGQVLTLTQPRFHRVAPGDSIFSISQRYAVSQFQLAQQNGLDEPFTLQVGQRLALPAELDFSVLETGTPNGLAGANALPAQPAAPAATETAAAAPVKKTQKRFVAPASGGNFTWPLEGEVVAEFGPAERGVHNDGINIAASAGTNVTAAATGTVAFIGRDIKSFGTLILVKHDGGIITAYAHLDAVNVQEGDIVSIGDKIGTVGQTGKVDTPQLHFEIRKSRRPIDPRNLIA